MRARILFFLNAITAISVSVLVKGLVTANQKEKDLTGILEKERSHLIAAKEELESEVEERRQEERALRESVKKPGSNLHI